jgi:hypothetical protein
MLKEMIGFIGGKQQSTCATSVIKQQQNQKKRRIEGDVATLGKNSVDSHQNKKKGVAEDVST